MDVVGEKPVVASPNVTTTCSPTSPPPNCAICLGTCQNKCFSNSCMHQFCFTCLLEWSKIKAECPLCKQTFKSIIHNVKSINEYDEHFIPLAEEQNPPERNEYLYLPPAPSRHQFHFRTTFTVDPGGEFAIQQMLMSHPLTNVMYMPGYNNNPSSRMHRRRRDVYSTSFRRSIYAQDLWVITPSDATSIYRDVSPFFYNANPAARTRLVPWLNRELNALLSENTQQVMHLVDVILEHLLRHHIRSRRFKNLLLPYLGQKTEHFIHEFYNFMRSPFDMVGYDRHVVYTERPQSPSYPVDVISDVDSEDSDVAVVNAPLNLCTNNPFHRPTIEVIEINSESSRDSDVIIREPSPTIVVNSDSDDVVHIEQHNRTEETRRTILPLKVRLKKRPRHDKRSKRRRHISSSTCSKSSSTSTSSSSSSSDSDSSSDNSHERKRSKRKRRHDRFKCKERRPQVTIYTRKNWYRSDSSSSDDDDDDDIPLSQLYHKKKTDNNNTDKSWTDAKKDLKKLKTETAINFMSSHGSNDNANKDSNLRHVKKEAENTSVANKKEMSPVPSTSNGRLRSIILRKESDYWYLRPRKFSSSDSSE